MPHNMRCLIIDDLHPSIIPLLQETGMAVDYRPQTTRAELIAQISGYQGLLVRSKTRIDAQVLDHAPQLRFIARAGAGLDGIDLDEAHKRNIAVFHAAAGNRDAVAEHAIGMLFCLMNNMLRADRQVRTGIWDREGNRGHELNTRTIGLIGYGNMGQAFAHRLQSFGCKVLAYDKYLTNWPDSNAQQVSLQQIFDQADILSLHVPLTAETRGMIDRAFLEQFNKPIWLLNTSRGEVVDHEALLPLLNQGRLLGAGLDVLENERFSELTDSQKERLDKLFAYDNVLFTPHVAGWTYESYEKISRVLAQKIREFVTFS